MAQIHRNEVAILAVSRLNRVIVTLLKKLEVGYSFSDKFAVNERPIPKPNQKIEGESDA